VLALATFGDRPHAAAGSRGVNAIVGNRSQLVSNAVHEASHEVVADRFGLGGKAFVAGIDCGVCLHEPGTLSQEAAISLAGVVGEDILSVRSQHRKLPGLPPPLTQDKLAGWFQAMEGSRWRELSAADQSGIRGGSDMWEVCQSTFDILTQSRATVRHLAKLLLDGLPAGDPEQELRAFIEARQAEASWKANQERMRKLEEQRAVEAAMVPPGVELPPDSRFNVKTFYELVVNSIDPIECRAAFRFNSFVWHQIAADRGHAGSNDDFTIKLYWNLELMRSKQGWCELARQFLAWAKEGHG